MAPLARHVTETPQHGGMQHRAVRIAAATSGAQSTASSAITTA
jgi:hypothetical protein